LAFGTDGSLYVLELDANGLLNPGDEGALTRIAPNGDRSSSAEFASSLLSSLACAAQLRPADAPQAHRQTDLKLVLESATLVTPWTAASIRRWLRRRH
jgi:hypothetical protein